MLTTPGKERAFILLAYLFLLQVLNYGQNRDSTDDTNVALLRKQPLMRVSLVLALLLGGQLLVLILIILIYLSIFFSNRMNFL